MSSATKQRISYAVCVLCGLLVLLCITLMVPPGLAGDAGKVKFYAVLAALALVLGLISGVVYYYYRSSADGSTGLDRMRIEVDTLSHAGRKADGHHDGDKKN